MFLNLSGKEETELKRSKKEKKNVKTLMLSFCYSTSDRLARLATSRKRLRRFLTIVTTDLQRLSAASDECLCGKSKSFKYLSNRVDISSILGDISSILGDKSVKI